MRTVQTKLSFDKTLVATVTTTPGEGHALITETTLPLLTALTINKVRGSKSIEPENRWAYKFSDPNDT